MLNFMLKNSNKEVRTNKEVKKRKEKKDKKRSWDNVKKYKHKEIRSKDMQNLTAEIIK